MTRTELRALIARIRREHPQVALRLDPELTPDGNFRFQITVPITQQVDISPSEPDIARMLPEEVEVMLEQASAETRENVRQLIVEREYAAEHLGHLEPPRTPVTPEARLEAADRVIADMRRMIAEGPIAAVLPVTPTEPPRPMSLWEHLLT